VARRQAVVHRGGHVAAPQVVYVSCTRAATVSEKAKVFWPAVKFGIEPRRLSVIGSGCLFPALAPAGLVDSESDARDIARRWIGAGEIS
jgi:hypothetical protein